MRAMKEVWTPLKVFGVRYYKDRDRNVYYKKVRNGKRRETKPFWKYKRFVIVTMLLLLAIPGGYTGYRIALDKASDKLVNEMASQVSKEDMNKLLQDPSVQEMMEKELGTKKAAELLQDYEVEASGIATSGISSEDMTFKQTGASSVQEEGQENPAASSSGEKGTNGQKESVPASADQKTSSGGNEKDPSKETPSSEQDDQPRPMFESRAEATKFVMSKFSVSEISSFGQMAQGGLTPEEKKEIQSKVKSRLTDKEYEALKLYGLIELSKQK